MNNYFISYEWDIVIISVLGTLLVLAILMQLSMLLSEWWHVSVRIGSQYLLTILKINSFIF